MISISSFLCSVSAWQYYRTYRRVAFPELYAPLLGTCPISGQQNGTLDLCNFMLISSSGNIVIARRNLYIAHPMSYALCAFTLSIVFCLNLKLIGNNWKINQHTFSDELLCNWEFFFCIFNCCLSWLLNNTD